MKILQVEYNATDDGHAQTVRSILAQHAPPETTVECWTTWDFVHNNLNASKLTPPMAADWRVENHSYVASAMLWNLIATRATDFRAERDNVLPVVALNNGSHTAVPKLPAHPYSALAVGLDSGNHSRGGSNLDGVGRCIPHLVVRGGLTSFATPVAAGAAAQLFAAGIGDARLVKAILLTSADHGAVPFYQSESKPLHPIYGAGLLDLPAALEMARGHQASVRFAAAGGEMLPVTVSEPGRLTATICWHRVVLPYLRMGFSARLPMVDLELWQDGALLYASRSRVDNLQHLHVEVPAGQYQLRVVGEGGLCCGVAWRVTPRNA